MGRKSLAITCRERFETVPYEPNRPRNLELIPYPRAFSWFEGALRACGIS